MKYSYLALSLAAVALALGCSPRTATTASSANTTSSVGGSATTDVVQPVDATTAKTGADTPSTQAAGSAGTQEAQPLSPSGDGTSDEIVSITFDDLKTEMPPDSKFEPSMLPEKAARLDGRRVRIRGFIFPSIMQQDGIREFPLVMNTQCKFGPGGQAHCIIIVDLIDDVTTSFTVRPVAVEGRLTVQPWEGPDGNTWSLYHMLGERVD